MQDTFAVVGPGRVGRALAAELQSVGWQLVGVVGRDDDHSLAAAETMAPRGGRVLLTRWTEICRKASVAFIATPDGALPGVAQELADQIRAADPSGEWPRPAVLHVSGAESSDVLAPLRAVGCSVGSLHPNQSFADPRATATGIAWGIEGDSDALAWARRVVERLSGTPLMIDSSAKPLYHAAACVASNYLVVLVGLATELLAKAGVPRHEGVAALVPLVRGSLQNVERLGIPAALTGPIERGDVQTLVGHLSSFEAYDVRADLASLYRSLGQEAMRLAVEKASIDSHTAEQIEAYLSGRC